MPVVSSSDHNTCVRRVAPLEERTITTCQTDWRQSPVCLTGFLSFSNFLILVLKQPVILSVEFVIIYIESYRNMWYCLMSNDKIRYSIYYKCSPLNPISENNLPADVHRHTLEYVLMPCGCASYLSRKRTRCIPLMGLQRPVPEEVCS